MYDVLYKIAYVQNDANFYFIIFTRIYNHCTYIHTYIHTYWLLGGFHCATVLSADMAVDRPLIITISAGFPAHLLIVMFIWIIMYVCLFVCLCSDNSARIWNYNTFKCELIHYFRLDEPIGVAFHPNGFQVYPHTSIHTFVVQESYLRK